MNKFSAASFFETTQATNMSDESDEENQLEIEELQMDKLEPVVVQQQLLINQRMIKQQQQQQQQQHISKQARHQSAMQLDESECEGMSAGEEDERDIDWDIIDPDEQDDDEDADHQPMQQGPACGGATNAAAASAQTPGSQQDPSVVQSLATQMAAAMAAAMAAHQLLSSAASICGLDLTSLSNFAASQAQQSATRPNHLQTPEQLMAAAVAAASFLQTSPTPNRTNTNTNSNNPTTHTVPEDLTTSQQQQQQQRQQQQQQHSLANGLFGTGLGSGGTSPLGQSGPNSKLLQDACNPKGTMDCLATAGGPKMMDGCNAGAVPRSDSAPESAAAMSAANAFMADTFNKQLVAAVQRMALASSGGAQNGLGNVLAQQQPQQQQQQSISSAASNYLYHHFGQDAASQQLSSSLLAAAQAAAAAQTLSNVPGQGGNGHHTTSHHHHHQQQQQQQQHQALQLNHLSHLSNLAAAGGALGGHHQAVGVSHHNHLGPASNHHHSGHHHHSSNSLANSLAAAAAANRSALLNGTANNTTNTSNNNTSNNNNSGNSNGHHHHPHHQQQQQPHHSTPTRHLLGHHHHSSIQTQQQLLATKGYNPLAAVVGQQTEILTPTHLRKAKLMFFYVRYPSSSTLKECFRDVRFNKNNTAQLVKWFSNFREFYYIQMEKFARECINDDRITCKEDIVVTYDHELINTLNNHYNKNRHIELPEVFRQVVEETLRHFFDAIYTKRDQEQSWKKAIYKIIQRMDQEVPDVFKTDAFNEHLE